MQWSSSIFIFVELAGRLEDVSKYCLKWLILISNLSRWKLLESYRKNIIRIYGCWDQPWLTLSLSYEFHLFYWNLMNHWEVWEVSSVTTTKQKELNSAQVVIFNACSHFLIVLFRWRERPVYLSDVSAQDSSGHSRTSSWKLVAQTRKLFSTHI